MLLSIIGIDKKEQFTVNWVELQTKVGNFIIQPEHAPMILEIEVNTQVRFCLENGKQQKAFISAGIAHITRQSTTILIDNNL